MKIQKIYKWIVDENSNSVNIACFIRDKLNNELSLRTIKRLLEQGFLKLNSHIEKFGSHRLATGDRIEFNAISSVIHPAKLEIFILYEDQSLVAVNKPSGFSSIPEQNNQPDVSSEIKKYYPGKFISILHRLDKDTSGVLLFAKNPEHEKFYLEQFRTHSVHKSYLAIVYGRPEPKKGKISSFLGLKEMKNNMGKWGTVLKNQGKPALTFYKTIEQFTNSSFMELRPVTGRTHQLRIHMTSIGHPVLGDKIYHTNKSSLIIVPRLMLHAYKISIIHAAKRALIEIESPIPDDIKSTKL